MATTWNIDPTHSEVQFKVKHLVISTVSGYFKTFQGTVTNDSDDFDGASASFNLDTSSIDTNVADRDAHLQSEEFFHSEKYPRIQFDGKILKISDEKHELTGSLTIKDITKEVKLAVEFGGTIVDGYGQTKSGFEVTGTINRKEFGLTWSMITEAGGVVVGDDVKLILNLQLVKS